MPDLAHFLVAACRGGVLFFRVIGYALMGARQLGAWGYFLKEHNIWPVNLSTFSQLFCFDTWIKNKNKIPGADFLVRF